MSNVNDIYKALAVRINYPVTPTYRCLEKIIGYINLLLSLTNTPQMIVEVPLKGSNHHKVPQVRTDKISYMLNGEPAKINPDGTIDTTDSTAYAIRNGLFLSIEDGSVKQFVTSETDVLADSYYLQPILTALYLVINGVQPNEAVMYINDACTRSVAKVDTRMIDVNKIRRRL